MMIIKKLSTRGYRIDITSNSRDKLTEKCTVSVRRINFQILGVKGLNKTTCQKSFSFEPLQIRLQNLFLFVFCFVFFFFAEPFK